MSFWSRIWGFIKNIPRAVFGFGGLYPSEIEEITNSFSQHFSLVREFLPILKEQQQLLNVISDASGRWEVLFSVVLQLHLLFYMPFP